MMQNFRREVIQETSVPVLIISVDKAGHVNQCLALCEMMGWRPDKIIRIPGAARGDTRWQKRKIAFLRRFYTLGHFLKLTLAKNLIIVASGSSPHSLVRLYRRVYRNRVFSVYAGTPKTKRTVYDIAVRSNHSLEGQSLDGLSDVTARTRGAKSTLLISGVPVKKLPVADLGCDHLSGIAILIGGKNKAFDISSADIVQQTKDYLRAHANPQVPVYVVFSRRTLQAVEADLRNNLIGERFHFVDRDDRTGFLQACGTSKEFIVTPDSVSMISEACISGKPVRLFNLSCVDSSSSTAKFAAEVVALSFAALIDAASVPSLNVLDESENIRNFVQSAIAPWIDSLIYRHRPASRHYPFVMSNVRP